MTMQRSSISITFLACITSFALLTPVAGSNFSAEELELPGKKGACFTLRESGARAGGTVDENMPRVKALNVSWNYSWGIERVDAQPSDIEFVPMIWGGGNEDRLENLIKDMRSDIFRGKVKRLLGFNEPDGEKQANMTVERALELWPILERAGVPLASPGAVHADREWMLKFMEGVRDKDLRVDYIAVHSYGGTSAGHFKKKLRRIYELHDKRPLLITEFAVADWKTGGDISKNRHSPAEVLAFMQEVLPWMEKQDWILGYAWFSFNIDSPHGYSSALFDQQGRLTPLGRYYRSVTPDNPEGDQGIGL